MRVLALEEVVLLDMNENVQVPMGSAISTGLAFSAQPQAGTVIHSGRNSDGHGFAGQHLALPMAGGAWVGDNLTLSPALSARGSNRKETLASTDLTCPTALRAGFWTGPGRRTAAFTIVAGFRFFHIDLFFGTESGFHEAQLHVIAQIRTPVGAASGSASPTETEKIFENIPETGKDIFKTTKTGKA